MAITFHCQSCKKKIKAPDETGGNWGKCPFCNYRCYIPLPPSEEDEELKLAPIDDSEETQYGSLMRETQDLTKNILYETAVADDDDDRPNEVVEKDCLKNIIVYLRMMADGQLEQAEQVVTKLARYKKIAKEILKKMALAEKQEPELVDVAPKVILGLMKDLNVKLE